MAAELIKRVKMEDQNSLRSVLIAWMGTAATWASLEMAQVVIGLVAGVTTIIYTLMKIWDWCDGKLKKRRSQFSGPHS